MRGSRNPHKIFNKRSGFALVALVDFFGEAYLTSYYLVIRSHGHGDAVDQVKEENAFISCKYSAAGGRIDLDHAHALTGYKVQNESATPLKLPVICSERKRTGETNFCGIRSGKSSTLDGSFI